ncbi:hypothetical protein [Cellvibrio mixtus]|uniref:hypothetical protein n=1 Tax=Cellvibrio mixtus TaxID=39650 RepID=UPI000587B755|nr:hypothetical protein [Cellvibrio mixtus]
MNANLTQINTSAVIALTRRLQEKKPRRQCITESRDELMAKLEMTRDAAELACWRVLAELESRNIPKGHCIDIANSTSQLLIVKTPNKKLVFTLGDLLGLHDQHGESDAETEQLKVVTH